jgi:hypothetical protein
LRDRGSRLRNPGFLLTAVQPYEQGPGPDPIAIVRVQLDERAGHLEAYLRQDLRLDRPQAKDLNGHIPFRLNNFDRDRSEQQRPCADRHARDDQD